MANQSNQPTFAEWVDSQFGAPLSLDEMLSLKIIKKSTYNKLKKEQAIKVAITENMKNMSLWRIKKSTYNKLKKEQAIKVATTENIKNECLWRIVNLPLEEIKGDIDFLEELGVDVDRYLDALVA